MKLFKRAKRAPIKFRGFKFVGYHNDYTNCCYYVKELPFDNFELMELMLEGTHRGPEIGAGTKVNVLDAFMSNYIYATHKLKMEFENVEQFVKHVVNTTYNKLEEKQQKGIVEQFSSKIPQAVKTSALFKKYEKQGYKVLYCSDDEKEKRQMAIVNIVLVKDEHLCSDNDAIDIDRHYTLFKPLKYMVTPGYITGKSLTKYFEEELPLIVVNHDILDLGIL